MNTKLILLAISVAAFSSCTTLYKSGQTPDDVYYSPTRLSGGDVDQRKEQPSYQANSYSSEERSIRLGVNDPRWRYLDDYNYSNSLYINNYSYSPYSYGFNYGYYYNPYFWPYPVYNYYPVSVIRYNPKNTTPRMANLSSYTPLYNNTGLNTSTHGVMTRPVRTYNNNNKGSAFGNVMRQVLTPTNNSSNNNNNNNSSNNNRSYSPSTSSSSSSGSSSSGSGGGVSRPARN